MFPSLHGSTEAIHADATALAGRWWTLAIRGVAAIVFGVLTFFWPGASLFVLVILFGAYALVDGIFNLVMAVRGAQRGVSWRSLVIEGVVSVAAGVVALSWPGITAFALLVVIAVWAVVTGGAEIAAAVRLRRHLRHEWLLGLAGAVSIGFGVLLMLFPGAGALAVALWIGAYAVVFGVLLLALAFRLRSWGREHPHEREAPSPA